MPDTAKLTEFVRWCADNITGDEKGQAQIFLDRLFQAFGQRGCLDVGGHTEFRIRKGKDDGGGTSFADYVWKPIVLVEMKKRGENLQRHFRQAFDYWTRLVPDRPRYVVLCNFDEFWAYDFETDLDSPKDKLRLSDLADRWGPLAFLAGQRPTFGSDREAVTRDAADKLALVFNELEARGVDRELAQRFTLQILVALFAEDIGLLDKYFVIRLLEDCETPADSYDLIGGLFEAMNTPKSLTGGRFKNVAYFNGGLFAEPARLELQAPELGVLRMAARADWSKVQPEIFGTLFQHSLAAKQRHTLGAHFTHPADIMKIVGPTIVDPWREQIEGAKTLSRLRQLADRLRDFHVLDPACGSGNFLYIAYRELKRLEARIYERMDQEFRSEAGKAGQIRLSFLSARNFYGLDIIPFAVEIAKVTMMIARKLAIDELHIHEDALPLDNLDENFVAVDALLTPENTPTRWPKADVIIGNPPFLGTKRLKPERGPEYVNAVREAYPDVPGMADYCVYWFRKAHDHLPPCTKKDPVAGRAGLVGTQNIRNNQSRVGGLDYVVEDGTIVEAVDNQPWSGEANVHVSIVNWVKTQDAALLPKTRRLWFRAEPSIADRKPRKRGSGPASKTFDLGFRECPFINSALSDQTDVSGARVLACNTAPQRVFQGITPGHEAFVLSHGDRARLIAKSERDGQVIHPYLIGDEILSGLGQPDRFVLDFGQRSIQEAQGYSAAFAHVQKRVLPDRVRAAEMGKESDGTVRPHHKQFLERWWRLSWDRADMVAAITGVSRYMVCSRVTKRPIFVFVHKTIRPGDALQVFVLEDDYSFGILHSHAHWLWFTTKCSKLKADFRYTPPTVFDTFPWPQSSTKGQVDAVAEAGREVRRVRSEALGKLPGGLRALYRTLELPGANSLKDAHSALDAAVLAAYGFGPKKDLLGQLLAMNLEVAERIERGKPVTPPGIPPGHPNKRTLVTADFVRPRKT